MRILIKLFYFFFFISFLYSCRKEIPASVIQPSEMENILYDYHLAQSMGNDFNGEERYKRDLLIQYVFEKHHITQAEFDSSMVWYTRNMEKLDDIYKKLGERYKEVNLEALQSKNVFKRSNIIGISGDSVNLWNGRRMYILSNDELTNKLLFNLSADTTYYELDRFVWNFKVDNKFLSNYKLFVGLTLYYNNDSTKSISCLLSAKEQQKLVIQADTLPLKKLSGYVYYEGNNKDNIIIRDITLMRYHASKLELSSLDSIKRSKQSMIQNDTLKDEHRENVIMLSEKDTLELKNKINRRSPADLRKQQGNR